jgi:hypothetical protein
MRQRRSEALRLNIRFCDLLGANLATSIRAERQAEQEAQAGRYRTFCDRLNPCFDKLLFKTPASIPCKEVNSFRSIRSSR